MKKFFTSLAVLFLCACCFAQEWSGEVSTTDKGKEYQSFLTNSWGDNIYIGVGGGLSSRFTFGEKDGWIKQNFVNPSIDLYLLKWFTPCVGLRLGYIGGNAREGLWYYHPYQISHSPFPYKVNGTDSYVTSSPAQGVLHYGSCNLHGDVLINITNTFFGYKPGRTYTLSAYISGAGLLLYDNKSSDKGLFSKDNDKEFAIGVGLYNTFRLSGRLVAIADLNVYEHASRYRTSSGIRTFVPKLSVGLAYNINKANWTDFKTLSASLSEYRDAQKAAENALYKIEQEKVELANTVDELNTEIDSLKLKVIVDPVVVQYADLSKRAENAELVLYFPIGQSTLNFSELYHLESYAKSALEANPDFVFHVTGSADKGTGTEKINAELSFNRANLIKSILMEKFGVKEENITIDTVVTDKHADGALDRCALIEK